MTWRGNSQRTKPDKVPISSYYQQPGIPPQRLTCISYPISGGSLGWKVRGSLHGDFEKVAYELEPSTTANPKCKFLIIHSYVTNERAAWELPSVQ